MLLTRQQAVFILIFLSYAVSLVVKRNASFWVTGVVTDGYATADTVGVLGSLWETANGVGKLLSAVIVDAASSPAALLAAALASQGGGALGLFASLSLRAASPGARAAAFRVAAAAWAFSGLAQAAIWPALTRVFMAWYPNPAQRGTWYAVLATSQNAGAALAPLLTDAAARAFGWRARVLVPAVLAISFAATVKAALQDRPPGMSVGAEDASSTRKASIATLTSPAPAAARVRPRVSPSRSHSAIGKKIFADDAGIPRERVARGGAALAENRDRGQLTAHIKIGRSRSPAAIRQQSVSTAASEIPSAPPSSSALRAVLTSGNLWLLSINYFFNSFVRNAVTATIDVLFRGAPGGLAATANMAYEVGGALGGLASGAISDAVFGSRRAPAMALFGAALIPLPLLLPALRAASRVSSGATETLATSHTLWVRFVFVVIGATAFPPHVLNGLVSREVARPDTMTAAAALTKSAGQAGAAMAEYLVISSVLAAGAVSPEYEMIVWERVAGALTVAAALSAITMLPLWNVKAWGQR